MNAKPPAEKFMRKLGLQPDPWQCEVLDTPHKQLLLNCSRQGGKSTAVAALALCEALWVPDTLVVLLSRSHRQSLLLLDEVKRFHERLDRQLLARKTGQELHFTNASRIVALPCEEETIRGYSNVGLLIIDEAARVPDDLYRAVRGFRAVSNGRLICLSTPYGKRGFFYNAWAREPHDWQRIAVPAERISRIQPEFLERERRAIGESWYQQEYCCSFEALEGLIYPDFAKCVVNESPPQGRWFGGIDFGLRAPFAAVWGVLDRDDVLWLFGERYGRDKSLAVHRPFLPKYVTWYADPEGAHEGLALRCSGLTVRTAKNAVRAGISAVKARLETGRLRVVQGCCTNLLAEAELYRWDPKEGSERPEKENDHAMDALRYLVYSLDAHKLARHVRRGEQVQAVEHEPLPPGPGPAVPLPEPPKKRKWLSIYNEALWTRLE
jgi:hypothetical protein